MAARPRQNRNMDKPDHRLQISTSWFSGGISTRQEIAGAVNGKSRQAAPQACATDKSSLELETG